MKFVLRNNNLNKSSRLGLLSFETNAKTTKEYSTPICLQYTINGSVPHIVSHLLDDLNDDKSPLLIPLPSTLLMNESIRNFNTKFDGLKSGIIGFTGFSEWRPSLVSIQDPLSAIRSGQNSVEGIGVFCRGGKQTVNSSRLIDVMANFRPDAYQALCDSDTPLNASNKRISKSVERSDYFLEECIEKHNECQQLNCEKTSILATIEGGFSLKARIKSVKESILKCVDGFVIDGFHSYGPEVETQLDFVSVKPLLNEIIKGLPEDKPKLMFGALPPNLILRLIENGIDIFDSSYASVMTEKGFALQQIIDLKLLKVNNNTLDLNSKIFKEDFSPIDSNCQCYSCSNGFSRAYINHLLNTSEMLAKVLLMFHNLHTFYEFFRTIRLLLEEEKFYQLLNKL